MKTGPFSLLIVILGGILGVLLAGLGVKPFGAIAVFGLSLSMFLVGYLWGDS